MGIQWCCSLIFWLILCLFVIKSVPAVIEEGASGSTTDACRIPGCNCSDAAKTWNIINCTFNSTQKVEFTSNTIPVNTIEVSIIGGGDVIFHPYTFNNLLGLQFLRIDNTRQFVIRKNAFTDLTSASLIVQVLNSDSVIIETHAFRNLQTPISMDISGCSYVSIQNSTFSRLQDGKFRNIPYLDLAESAFYFENQGMFRRHGPVTSLSFYNVIMPKIPSGTFHSSLAEISIKNSEVREIHSEAFRASQVSAVLFINSTIHKIQSGAFSDRTLLIDFKLSKCKVHVLESKAVMASVTNLTVEYCKITEIQKEAIGGLTVAKAIITDNEIGTFHSKGFILNNWNRINMDNNIIKRASSFFLEVPYNPDIQHVEFTFIGNEIYKIEPNGLSFMPDLQYTVLKLKFDNNFFNQTCYCDIDKWVLELLGNSGSSTLVLNSSFCTIDAVLARCFELQEGLINMRNFTQLLCGLEESIKCEPYSGETKVLDTTTIIDTEEVADSNSGLILGLVLGALVVISVSGTIVILLIRGGLWLKRKGYCMRFRNLHYRADHPTPEEEGTIVAIESRDKLDVPEELTPEILQRLREQLEDPTTHDDAREMIERLYELFITGDSYTNNNRQDEEAHLYEELGNLQNPHLEQEKRLSEPEPFGFLRMMEEKYNTTALAILGNKPALADEYSEPTDAAVHLYSELQNKADEISEPNNRRDSLKSIQSNTQRSNHSRNIAFRPLPEKPKSCYESEAGPSKKF
ncbi:hypothetical protein FQR65_LT07355 [Abscondita terminalis]|nr:hypothetical protein FQR65_LT07355 [Abscondita terminalis]